MDKEMSFWIKLLAGMMILWGLVSFSWLVIGLVKYGSTIGFLDYLKSGYNSSHLFESTGNYYFQFCGFIYFLTGIYILRRKRWARILALYSSAIWVCYYVVTLMFGIFNINFSAAIMVFVLFPITLVHLFFFLMLKWKRMKEQFECADNNIMKNDTISFKLIALITVLVIIITCFIYFRYKKHAYKDRQIPFSSITFLLGDKDDKNNYTLHLSYMGDEESRHGFPGHHIMVEDKNGNHLVVFSFYLKFNSTNGMIFEKSFETSQGNGLYFILGKGKIVNGKFIPDFLSGTTFIYHPDQDDMYGAWIIIRLPKTAKELTIEKIEGNM